MADTLNDYLRLNPPVTETEAVILGMLPNPDDKSGDWKIHCRVDDPVTGLPKNIVLETPINNGIDGYTVLTNTLPQDNVSITMSRGRINANLGVKYRPVEIVYTSYRGRFILLSAKASNGYVTLYGERAASVFLASYAWYGYNTSKPQAVGAYAVHSNDTKALLEGIHSVSSLRDTYHPEYYATPSTLSGINLYHTKMGSLKISALTEKNRLPKIFLGISKTPTSLPVPSTIYTEAPESSKADLKNYVAHETSKPAPDWAKETVSFQSSGVHHDMVVSEEVSALYRGMLPVLGGGGYIITGKKDGYTTLLRLFK